MSDFERENRYVVFKISDVEKLNAIEKKALFQIGQSIDEIRQARGKAGFEAVVIESDWPEYEPVWDMLQDRMTGVQQTPDPEPAIASMQGEVKDVGMALQYGNDKTAAVFDAEIVPIGTKLYTHAPDSAARIAEQDARIAELEQQLGEARKDAERYLALRCESFSRRFNVLGDRMQILTDDLLDEAVDAWIEEISHD